MSRRVSLRPLKPHRLLVSPQRTPPCLFSCISLFLAAQKTKISVIHRDIKPSNILLDDKLRAKVGDFGISTVVPNNEKTHITTGVKGTVGYLDPLYHVSHQLTRKSDVYSFGIVLLELVSGRRAVDLTKAEQDWQVSPLKPEQKWLKDEHGPIDLAQKLFLIRIHACVRSFHGCTPPILLRGQRQSLTPG